MSQPQTHTLGPWREFSPNGEITIVDQNQVIVARLDTWETPEAVAEMEANAKLIAGAPDLLAALEEVIPAQDDYDTCAAALEAALEVDQASQKTREYFRAAKTRLLKAREAARAALKLAKP